ncbi:MAG TPA: hypothetical protein VGK74_02610 [Symbiobacteriaceae bacterium]
MGKVIEFPGRQAGPPPVRMGAPAILDLAAVSDALELLHGMRGAPVEAFEDVMTYVDELREEEEKPVPK